MAELIIDKKTNISRIQNKLDYTSLVLKTKVNPKKLIEFKNIKELTLDYVNKNGKNYNEQHINELPFKERLEKLVFKKNKHYGDIKGWDNKTFALELPNLKSITFPSTVALYNVYLEKLNKLEEIIFEVDDISTLQYIIYLYSEKLKKIIIKYKDKEYVIEPDYTIDFIDALDKENSVIKLDYSPSDKRIESKVRINTSNDEIKINNTFDIYSDDWTLEIPDFTTELVGLEKGGLEKIIFNLKLLNFLKNRKEIINKEYYKDLETIEINYYNEMSLFPSIKIDVKKYGVLKELYIENNTLYLDYIDTTITINNKGEINKIIKEVISISEESKDLDLKKYTLTELENYASYLRLLKLSSDKKYQEAMKVVEKEVIKKLTK